MYIFCYYAAILIGCILGLARPSLCLLHMGCNLETKPCRKTKIGVSVSEWKSNQYAKSTAQILFALVLHSAVGEYI